MHLMFVCANIRRSKMHKCCYLFQETSIGLEEVRWREVLSSPDGRMVASEIFFDLKFEQISIILVALSEQ